MTFTTRFAPSPTGPLHLGHAYSALLAHDMARANGGEFLLRIEDTDTGRCKPEYEASIFEDLEWLGLSWEQPVWRQSERLDEYDSALEKLVNAGLCYPCDCSRKDIRDALSAPQEEQPHVGPGGIVYPGTCRRRTMADRRENSALRLDMNKAIANTSELLGTSFQETGPAHKGVHVLTRDILINEIGDIVLARRDTGSAAYHVSVVVDDATQAISHVIRGSDLFNSTFIHVALQTILGLPTPHYHHHKLIRDKDEKRLAKRTDARSIAKYRADGVSPEGIRELVGLT